MSFTSEDSQIRAIGGELEVSEHLAPQSAELIGLHWHRAARMRCRFQFPSTILTSLSYYCLYTMGIDISLVPPTCHICMKPEIPAIN